MRRWTSWYSRRVNKFAWRNIQTRVNRKKNLFCLRLRLNFAKKFKKETFPEEKARQRKMYDIQVWIYVSRIAKNSHFIWVMSFSADALQTTYIR